MTDSLLVDPTELEQLAQEREDDNWRFRCFLKAADLETEGLDAIVHQLYEEVMKRFPARSIAESVGTAAG